MATVKYQVVHCDECKHEFKLKPKIMKVEKVAEGVERHYFLCPKCKRKYIVMYQDKEYKDNLKEMEHIRQKASELRMNDERYLRLSEQHKWYQQKNLKISSNYKQIYGS